MAEDDTKVREGEDKIVTLFDLLRQREAQACEPSTRDHSMHAGEGGEQYLWTAPPAVTSFPSPLHNCSTSGNAYPFPSGHHSVGVPHVAAPRSTHAPLHRVSKGAEHWIPRQADDISTINLTCIRPTLMALFGQGARDAGGLGAVELWLLKNQHAAGPLVELHLRARWEDADYILRKVSETGELGREAAEYLRRESPEVARPGQDLAGVLYSEVQELSVNRWRRLDEMAQDPLLPTSRRTSSAAKLFHLCGGAKVGSVGLLAFYTKYASKSSPIAQCTSSSALPYLTSLAASAAALVSVAAAREDCFGHRLAETRRRWHLLGYLVRSGTLSLYAREMCVFEEENRHSNKSILLRHNCMWVWLGEYFRKWRGIDCKPAPTCNWTSFWWTFGGVAANLLLISGLNQLIIRVSDVYFLLIGSLGALNTLMFAAPNAPLVQPRNIIGGHMVACAIAVLWMYFSSPVFLGLIPQWVSCALAPAMAIAVMGRLGITHPPAGAACLIYVSAPFQSTVASLGWMYLIMPILASASITLFMGMAWNNLSKQRQYPIYW